MKFLIIGATSFIGPYVLEKILPAFPGQEDIVSCLVRTGTDKEKIAKLENLSLSYQMKAKSIFTNEQLERLPWDCILDMGTGSEISVGIGRGPRRGPHW